MRNLSLERRRMGTDRLRSLYEKRYRGRVSVRPWGNHLAGETIIPLHRHSEFSAFLYGDAGGLRVRRSGLSIPASYFNR